MSPEQLSQLATFGLAVPAIAGGIVALWAIRALGRFPRNERPDRGTALKLAAIFALLPVAGLTAVFAMIGQAFGGSMLTGVAVGLPLGAGVGLAVLLSGLAGYAALARPGRGSVALVGVLLGPLVLGGATALAAQVKGMADAAYYRSIYGPEAQAAREQEIARIKSLLDVRVVDVRATTFEAIGPGGDRRTLVEGVRFTLVVRAAEPIALREAGRGPRAWFFPNAEIASGFDVAVPITTPLQIAAGETTYVIEDRWPDQKALVGWPEAPQPGPWTLIFSLPLPGFGGDAEAGVEVGFDVPAP